MMKNFTGFLWAKDGHAAVIWLPCAALLVSELGALCLRGDVTVAALAVSTRLSCRSEAGTIVGRREASLEQHSLILRSSSRERTAHND
jgi:hypothetical protein